MRALSRVVVVGVVLLGACSDEGGRASATADAGPALDGAFDDFGEACGACLRASCGNPGLRCASSSACLDVVRCFEDGGSWIDCEANALEVSLLVDDVLSCGRGPCTGFCDLGARWSCVGRFDWPEIVLGTVRYRPAYRDPVAAAPLANVRVTACLEEDVDCATPVGESVSDAGGFVDVVVPASRDGRLFFEATGPLAHERRYFNVPPVRDVVGEVAALTEEAVSLGFDAIEVAPDPARGQLLAVVEDCTGTAAAGAVLEVSTADAASTSFYVDGVAPAVDLEATTTTGVGGVANVPAGPATIVATHGGEVVATARVQLKAGILTWVHLRPDAR